MHRLMCLRWAILFVIFFSQALSASIRTPATVHSHRCCSQKRVLRSNRGSATPRLNHILYGASYYPEYMPSGRLQKDISLMKAAGINVVRMGESTWSVWEPEDGHFDFSRMDRVIAAMSKAHIQVILGTPTYSIPPWLYKEHPEILARPLGGAPVFYGMRQNIDTDNPVFRFYAARIIRKLVTHYRTNPDVIGWQIDNETSSNGASNIDVFDGFRRYLESKFKTPEALDKAWLLQYWGQTIHKWDELPTRDSAQSTGYKLEWSRWQQIRVTRYLRWQADLVRRHDRPDQFVTQDFSGAMHRDVNEFDVAHFLDVASVNVYARMQSAMTGEPQALAGDFTRSLRHANYFVTETNAESTGWSSAWQFPPYDGQLRLNVYSNLASGADMVAFWPWASIDSGQETYWNGILGHDLSPGRVYREATRTGQELSRISSHLADLHPHNRVAILYSVDSFNGLHFMPFTHGDSPEWTPSTPVANYETLVEQLHKTLFDLNVGTDFIFPEDADFSRYSVIVVPALYVASDELLEKLADYVRQGGHVLMTFKSGYCDQNSAVRSVLMPGLLREAAGFSYQEYSSLAHPLPLCGDPFHAGADNRVSYWAEFIILKHAQALAYYDDPFFGRWPAITLNHYGRGVLVYEGSWLSDALQKKVMMKMLRSAGISLVDATQPSSIRVRREINSQGDAMYFYLNYSGNRQVAVYHYRKGVDLFSGKEVDDGQQLVLQPWGVSIVESPSDRTTSASVAMVAAPE